MNVYKWTDGRLRECGKVESLFSFWASSVPDDYEQFIEEHEHKTEEHQIEEIAAIRSKRIAIERAGGI